MQSSENRPTLNLRQTVYRAGAELRHTSIVATIPKTSTLPAIVESYRDCEPPPKFRKTGRDRQNGHGRGAAWALGFFRADFSRGASTRKG